MFFLVLLGLVILAGIIYMAISRRSTIKVRIAALGALALMIITVIVCLLLYFKAAATPQQLLLPDAMPSDVPPPASGNDVVMVVMYIIFMLALFGAVMVLAMREQRRVTGKESRDAGDTW